MIGLVFWLYGWMPASAIGTKKTCAFTLFFVGWFCLGIKNKKRQRVAMLEQTPRKITQVARINFATSQWTNSTPTQDKKQQQISDATKNAMEHDMIGLCWEVRFVPVLGVCQDGAAIFQRKFANIVTFFFQKVLYSLYHNRKTVNSGMFELWSDEFFLSWQMWCKCWTWKM